MRCAKLVDYVANIAVQEGDSDDEMRHITFLEDPTVVSAAHNGFRFDFPLLLCELLRNDISTTIWEQWHFIDML